MIGSVTDGDGELRSWRTDRGASLAHELTLTWSIPETASPTRGDAASGAAAHRGPDSWRSGLAWGWPDVAVDRWRPAGVATEGTPRYAHPDIDQSGEHLADLLVDPDTHNRRAGVGERCLICDNQAITAGQPVWRTVSGGYVPDIG